MLCHAAPLRYATAFTLMFSDMSSPLAMPPHAYAALLPATLRLMLPLMPIQRRRYYANATFYAIRRWRYHATLLPRLPLPPLPRHYDFDATPVDAAVTRHTTMADML